MAAERTSLRVRLAAESCCALSDSSRRGMSWKICRFSAARPEPRSALEPPGLAPFRRLFRFSASVDRQMTPALFARLFRASRFRLAHWRTGCRARLRRPSDLKHHAAPDCGEGMSSVEKNAACLILLAHHTAPDCREGMASVELKLSGGPSDLKHHAAPNCWASYRALRRMPPASFSLRITRCRTAGRGWLPLS